MGFTRRQVLGFIALASCARTQPRPPRAPGSAPHVRVLSYNVNYGLPGEPSIVAAIGGARADVVALQETNSAWELALRQDLRGEFPFMSFRHCCGAGGLALLSRMPFDDPEVLRPPHEGWFPAWRTSVFTPVGRVQLLIVHLHPPVSQGGSVVSGAFTTGSIREREILAHLARLDRTLPTLVLGDFNEEPGGAVFARLREADLRDAIAEFQPDVPTWRWHAYGMDYRRQLDHIFYDARLQPLSATIIQAGASDHLPVLGVFELAPPP